MKSPLAVRLLALESPGRSQDPEAAIPVEDQVRRLDVPVDHALRMGVLGTIGHAGEASASFRSR